MKNIRKRKDGRWEARKQINNNKYCVIATTKEECLKKFRSLIKNIKSNNLNSLEEKNITFINWWNLWLESYKKPFISKDSYKSIIYNFKLLEKYDKQILKTKLKDITTLQLQNTLNKIPICRSKELLCTYLNACLDKAFNLNKINKNPFVNVIKDKKINEIRKPFTYDEQVKVLKALNNSKIYAPIMTYLLTGIRKNELNTTNIKNDIMTDNTLKVLSEKKRKKNSYRYINITEKTKNMILNNLNHFKHTTKYFYKQFKIILNNLNIDGNIQTLRHTFTTNHLYLGTPEKFIQEWLGHEDISITKKHYMSIDRTLSKEKLLELYDGYYYIIN